MTQNEFLELCAHGDYSDVSSAIEAGIDPNECGNINGEPVSGMFLAVAEKNYETIDALLHNGVKSSDGFIASVITGNMEVAEYLASLNRDVNENDKNNHSPLLTAIMMNKKDAVRTLIRLGADVNSKVSGNYNVLTYAAVMLTPPDKDNAREYELDPEIISILMEEGSNYEDAFLVAIRADNDEFARLLIKNGADANMKDSEGRSILMYAVLSASTKILRVLLENGADPNEPDKNGRTPLMIASISEEPDFSLIEMLLEFGADINAQDKKGLTALMWAAAGRDKVQNLALHALIRTGAVNAKEGKLWCSFFFLYEAVKREMQLEVLRVLIKNGADVNMIESRGMNALAFAMMNFDDEAADILTEAGAQLKLF